MTEPKPNLKGEVLVEQSIGGIKRESRKLTPSSSQSWFRWVFATCPGSDIDAPIVSWLDLRWSPSSMG
ncbi:hypothetical protein V6N13_135465 [Hibiscus sabdariffa]